MFIEPVGGGGGSVHRFRFLLLYRLVCVTATTFTVVLIYCNVLYIHFLGLANPGIPAESRENNGCIIRVGVHTEG
jgi:hypothetical protein